MPNPIQSFKEFAGRFRYWGRGGTGSSGGWFALHRPNQRINYEALAGDPWTNSAVGSAAWWLQRNCLGPRLIVQRQGVVKGRPGWIEVPNHRLPQIFDDGPFYDGATLMAATLLSMIVDGNAYWSVQRDDFGRSFGFAYIPHFRIKPMADEQNPEGESLVTYYEYDRADGQKDKLDPTNVIHFRTGIDPRNPMKGLSPLMAAIREVVGHNEASTIGTALMLNAGVGALIASATNGVKEGEEAAAFQQTVRKINSRLSQPEESGTVTGVGIPIKVDKIGFSPRDMDLRGQRAAFVEAICASIGLDPMVLGLPSQSKTYSNYGEAIEAATEGTLLPLMQLVAKSLTRQTLNVHPYPFTKEGDRVWWDFSDVRALQGDVIKNRESIGKLFRDGVITRATAKEELGYQPEPGDEVYATDLAPASVEAKSLAERIVKRRNLERLQSDS